MSIRIKTIIGIVLIQVAALGIVVWANIDLLSKSNAELFDDQANAVAALAAQRLDRLQDVPGGVRRGSGQDAGGRSPAPVIR